MGEPNKRKIKVVFPNLGLTAASFATVLTILNLSNRSYNLIVAVNSFSIGIPLIIGCLPLSRVKLKNPFLIVVFFFNSFSQIVGSFFCLYGIYKCFFEISAKSGTCFAGVAIFYFLLTSILLFVEDQDVNANHKEGFSHPESELPK